jgi:hypothetical protein
MDWNKAKNYLIAGLIIANMVLALGMLSSSTGLVNKVGERGIRGIDEILALKNIRLSDDVEIMESRVMDIFGEYRTFNVEEIANDLITFPKRMDESAYTDGEYSVRSQDGGRRITYFSAGMESFDESDVEWTIRNPEEMADGNVAIMLDKANIPHSDLYLVKTAKLGELTMERYEYFKSGILVESSGITVVKDNGSISYMDARIADVSVREYSKAVNVTPAQALQRFQSRFKPVSEGEATVVTRVELIYRMGPLESEMSLKSADGMAYWRIYTEDKQVYYIEAAR